jgi:CelD/BcsL family acetyltransferase involved in cellulose biosynthesis
MSTDIITEPEIGLAAFNSFREAHEAQWRAQGKMGHFADWPHAVEFNTALVRRQGELGRLRMILLRADQTVVSYQYGYAFGGCYYWRFNSRAFGPDWDHLGLGNLSLVEETRALIPEGIRSIEAGFGHYDYKMVWGGKEYQLQTFLVVGKRYGARLRCGMFMRFTSWLNLLYYRIWFQRLAPKLPLRRRPLWLTWIRSQL